MAKAKSEAVKLAQMEERREYIKAALGIVTNPLLLCGISYYLSDRLQGDYVKSQPYQGTYKGEPAWITEKRWDHNAGKLNAGAAFAWQTGITAYLTSGALSSLLGGGGLASLLKG